MDKDYLKVAGDALEDAGFPDVAAILRDPHIVLSVEQDFSWTEIKSTVLVEGAAYQRMMADFQAKREELQRIENNKRDAKGRRLGCRAKQVDTAALYRQMFSELPQVELSFTEYI